MSVAMILILGKIMSYIKEVVTLGVALDCKMSMTNEHTDVWSPNYHRVNNFNAIHLISLNAPNALIRLKSCITTFGVGNGARIVQQLVASCAVTLNANLV